MTQAELSTTDGAIIVKQSSPTVEYCVYWVLRDLNYQVKPEIILDSNPHKRDPIRQFLIHFISFKPSVRM